MRLIPIVSMLAFATVAAAQDAPRRPMMSDACRTEVMTVCPPTGDRGAMRQCVVANVAKFSAPCKTELAKMRAMMQQRRQQREGNGGDATPSPSSGDNGMSSSPTPQ